MYRVIPERYTLSSTLGSADILLGVLDIGVLSYALALSCLLNVCIGSAAIAQPAINLTAFSAAANAAFGTTLSPVFSYATANLTFLDSAFLLEDVGKSPCPVSNLHLFLSVTLHDCCSVAAKVVKKPCCAAVITCLLTLVDSDCADLCLCCFGLNATLLEGCFRRLSLKSVSKAWCFVSLTLTAWQICRCDCLQWCSPIDYRHNSVGQCCRHRTS